MSSQKSLGQYFTTAPILLECVQNYVQNNPNVFLEPSCGNGDLVRAVLQKYPHSQFVGCEIDPSLEFSSNPNVSIGDFMKTEYTQKFKTIVGNPPFVKTKTMNLFLKFIDRCVDLLDQKGELVFIVPSDVFYMTSGRKLMKKMWELGTFTNVFKPNRENLFAEASVDVVVFRFQLGNFERKMEYNNTVRFAHNHDNVITFQKHEQNIACAFKDVFDIYVGFVSGNETVFKNYMGNVMLINDQYQQNPYIIVHNWEDATAQQKQYLTLHKKELISRKVRKFNENNWWQFGLLRNYDTITENLGKPCIYLKMITRKRQVAWEGSVAYFGGSLLCLIPKKQVKLQEVVSYLNSEEFQEHWRSSGRFRITHRVLSNCVV